MKMRVNKWIAVVLLTVGMLSLFGCAKQAGNTATAPVTPAGELNTATKLVVGHNLNYFPIIVAYEKGFFKEEFGDKVEVEIPHFANGPAQNEAVTTNQIDIANMGDMPTIQVWGNGVDIQVISYLWESPKGYSMIANKKSGIQKLEDIKGKKIAIQFGSNFHKALLNIVRALGYSENDIEMLNLQKAEGVTALTQGVIDAAVLDEPQRSKLLARDDMVEVSTTEGYDKIMVVAYGRGEYLRKNPEIVARYLKVINQTNKWIAGNLDESVQIVAKFMGSEDLEGTRKYYIDKVWKVGVDQDLVDALNNTIEFSLDQGFITKQLDADDLVDDTYVKLIGLGQ